jgi:hypothetical protein
VVERLSLRGNEVNNYGATHLARAFAVNNTLTEVYPNTSLSTPRDSVSHT